MNGGGGIPVPFLLFGVFIAVIIVAAIFSHQQEKKRLEELRQYADAKGLTFDEGKRRGYHSRYLEFDFLDRGSNRYAHNILAGKVGAFSIEAFDYHYETHSRDSDGKRKTHHHRFSVAIIEVNFPLREMTVRPEGIFDKLSAAFGWDDINFESAEFSRKFHVKSPDRRWAYDVLHPRMMEYLLSCPRYELHFANCRLAVRGQSRFEPFEFAKAIEMGTTVVEGIPEFAREI